MAPDVVLVLGWCRYPPELSWPHTTMSFVGIHFLLTRIWIGLGPKWQTFQNPCQIPCPKIGAGPCAWPWAMSHRPPKGKQFVWQVDPTGSHLALTFFVPTIHVKLVTWAAHIYIYIKDGSSGEATPLIQHTGWGGRGRLSYLRCDSWGWG